MSVVSPCTLIEIKESLLLTPDKNSSVAGRSRCEDMFEATIPHDTTKTTVVELTNGLAVHQGSMEPQKHCCIHPGCDGRFAQKKDLKRHEKIHDPNSTLWYCGCCQNLGDKLKGGGKTRKDKVQSHIRKIHDESKSMDNKGIICPEDHCYFLFTGASCVDEHLREYHRLDSSSHGLNGEQNTRWHEHEPNKITW